MHIRHSQHNKHHAGFTLAEMMVVIVILGLLATLVVPNVLRHLLEAQVAKAKQDIVALSNALDSYAVSNSGRYPENLDALVLPDINGQAFLNASRVPLDPWQHPYGYEPPSPGRPHPRVYTLGKDGQPGGEGADRDIDNDQIRDGDEAASAK